MNLNEHPATSQFLEKSPSSWLRAGISIFALILSLGGAFTLLPALLRPKNVDLPVNAAAAASLEPAHARALLAAYTAVIRGDLWAQVLYTDATLLWLDPASAAKPANLARVDRAHANVERSLSLAPVNGKAWFYAAKLGPTPAYPRDKTAAVLAMSYFTAPSDQSLNAPRLAQAAGSEALNDPQIQDFVKFDIRRILLQHPEKKQDIIAAFATALPQNRALFKSLADEVDPDFAASLVANAATPAKPQ
jgi:hypothetical protein